MKIRYTVTAAFLFCQILAFADLPSTTENLAIRAQMLTIPSALSLGEMNLQERKEYAVSLGEDVNSLDWGVKPFEHAEHQVGYLPFGASTGTAITPASQIIPDRSLQRIVVRLDHISVFDYPGRGSRRIMIKFEAKNKLTGSGSEDVTFSQTYDAQEGEGAPVTGFPIFVGLNVGPQGVAFQAATINVENKGDKAALDFMKSGPFKEGLQLLTTAQPAIVPFSGTITGLTEMILKRNENKKVQDFFLGLDFDQGAAFGARLAEGNYIVIQAPSTLFKWIDWSYDSDSQRIVKKSDGTLIPFNYICFRVSKN